MGEVLLGGCWGCGSRLKRLGVVLVRGRVLRLRGRMKGELVLLSNVLAVRLSRGNHMEWRERCQRDELNRVELVGSRRGRGRTRAREGRRTGL